MRLFRFIATFVIITLFLVACTSPSKITIVEMENFQKTKANTTVEITDEEEIDVILQAVKNATKDPGTVDIAEPEYKFEYGQKSYFLWIQASTGTIMKTSNTNTTYTLDMGDSDQFFEIITRHYGE
ncbi:hypothetical protein NC661_17985 [Aquibacillus koreensis]|uniref:YhfM-like domain-containing protein n=1 Tax=Aquibacillus koreensis TaxID=279446 RepID=A0A9X4AL96_9BACI|nr:hypothetical protein [Aquibacillus koreensis]MCT2535408.1 hypothetical protein [Aquibacillus koreensis]MDC3422243.1 hypothetical protein [Aquibacillus koreensis]